MKKLKIDNSGELLIDIAEAGGEYKSYLPAIIYHYGKLLKEGKMTKFQKDDMINDLSNQEGMERSVIEKIINKHIK